MFIENKLNMEVTVSSQMVCMIKKQVWILELDLRGEDLGPEPQRVQFSPHSESIFG